MIKRIKLRNVHFNLQCVANAEAYIDFSEDDNIEDGVMDQGMDFQWYCFLFYIFAALFQASYFVVESEMKLDNIY